MDDYLKDIGAEVEINPVEVEYYDSSVATPPVVKRKKLGKTKLLSNDEKKGTTPSARNKLYLLHVHTTFHAFATRCLVHVL